MCLPPHSIPFSAVCFPCPRTFAATTDGACFPNLHPPRRGVVRITPDREASLFLSGPGIVGLAFTPAGAAIVATSSMLYSVNCGIFPRV